MFIRSARFIAMNKIWQNKAFLKLYHTGVINSGLDYSHYAHIWKAELLYLMLRQGLIKVKVFKSCCPLHQWPTVSECSIQTCKLSAQPILAHWVFMSLGGSVGMCECAYCVSELSELAVMCQWGWIVSQAGSGAFPKPGIRKTRVTQGWPGSTQPRETHSVYTEGFTTRALCKESL